LNKNEQLKKKTCNFIPTILSAQVPSNKKVGALKLHKEQNFTSAKGVQGLYVSYKNSCAGEYRYGFNGKEKDNEVKGTGNSLDFGARIQDSRLGGRWLSLDPLMAKYPGMSAYNFCSNNPIYYIEVDGKYFTGNQELVKETYKIVCKLSKQGDIKMQAFKARLEVMDKSDVEYYSHTEKLEVKSADNLKEHGITTFDIKNNRVDMLDYDIYSVNPSEMLAATEYSIFGVAGHELDHGGQFEEHELNFDATGKGGGSCYDKFDECRASETGSIINCSLAFPSFLDKVETNECKTAETARMCSAYNDRNPNERKVTINTYSKENINRKDYKPTQKQIDEKKPILGN
jgi:RHS repeat-associated protein